MGDKFLNKRFLRGVWAACLAVLLSVQFAVAFQPDARDGIVLSDTEVLLQICSTPGSGATLVFDTATGEIRDVPSGDTTKGAECPYCVVGAAFLMSALATPILPVAQQRAEFTPSATDVLLVARRDFSRTPRAPPLTL
ncbi:DUF2946 domain-containing protein [Celeribacter naphthalenivorans]|uniref:DUF2946 domain-containing protein n=1 Tax=Celeribacter naphthalenivorans TaxID=1614694 RepID=UPI001CFA4D44|nr:DUF2946 domain-containing protein [Celeribacter naphthalenivorans]